MHDLKIIFPKLKVFSSSNISQSTKHHTTPITHLFNKEHSPRAKTFQQTLKALKYHYVNKSPHYYRSRNKTVQSTKLLKQQNKSIKQYILELSRTLDKQFLLKEAKQRTYRLQNYNYLKNNSIRSVKIKGNINLLIEASLSYQRISDEGQQIRVLPSSSFPSSSQYKIPEAP